MYFIHTMFKAVDDFIGNSEQDKVEMVDVEEEPTDSHVSEPVSEVPEPDVIVVPDVAIEVSEPAIVEPEPVAISEKKTIKNRFADFISKYFGCAATNTVAP